jgi:uncharacterized membrane protein
MNGGKESTNSLSIYTAKIAVIAAVYAALTIVLGPLAYGEIQVRISDAMLILPFLPGYGMEAVLGLTLGGFLANLASPFGYIDWVFGPIANFAATITIYVIRKLIGENNAGFFTGAISASIIIALIIGYGELHLVFDMPIITVVYVLAGELISIVVGGWIIYYAVTKRLH